MDTGSLSLELAARLSGRGHEVVVLRDASADAGAATQAGVRPGSGSRPREGASARATSDPFEALAAGDVVVVAQASPGLDALESLVLPLVEPRHVLVFTPGAFRSLECAAWLTGRGRSALPTLVEADRAAVVELSRDDRTLALPAELARPGLGVFPAARTDASWPLLADLFPAAHLYPHVLAAALADPLPPLLATAALLNRGESCVSQTLPERFSPDVARIAARVDDERLALGAALGLDLVPAAQELHRLGVSPLGDLWAAVHGSRSLARGACAHAPEEAVGTLRPFVGLADLLAVPLPVTRALLELAEALSDVVGLEWTFGDLGLPAAGAGQLLRYLESGEATSPSPADG